MNTQNIPDDELDDFFKKSLEKPEINFREEDWLHLEKKLNSGEQQKLINRKYLYSLIAILILSVALISWLMVNNTTGTSTNIQAGKEVFIKESIYDQTLAQPSDRTAAPATAPQEKLIREAQIPTSSLPDTIVTTTTDRSDKIKPIENRGILKNTEKNKTTSTKTHEDKITIESNKTPNLPGNRSLQVRDKTATAKADKRLPIHVGIGSGKPLEGKNTVATKAPATEIDIKTKEPGQTNMPESEIPTATEENTLPFSSDKVQRTEKTETLTRNTKTPAEQSEDIFPQDNTIEDSNDAALPEAISEAGEESTRSIEQINSLSLLAVKTSEFQSSLQEKYTDALEKKILENALATNTFQKDTAQRKLATKRIITRWSLNLLVSPDLSSVGFSKKAAPGTNTGISLEYNFSNAWSISAGAIYSTKIYGADAKDYTPKPGFWTYYVWPVEVKGNCKVIDIPINIRYNFLRKEKYHMYASTGLSSYLMLKEDYKYIYDVDDTHLRKTYQTSNENKHFFKVYNVSLGYERRLGNKFSLQAEPFIKLPLAGVGYGKIKLLSTGAFLSLKYRL